MTAATLSLNPPVVAPISASGPWVDASPFRAQLRHLMAAGNLTAAEVALLAGLSPRFATHLHSGRGGRALKRISPEQAGRLLRLSAVDLALVGRREVVAALASRPARRLRDAGWTVAELAGLLGLSCSDTSRLLDGTTEVCSQLVAVRASAEAALLGIAPDEDLDPDELPLDLVA